MRQAAARELLLDVVKLVPDVGYVPAERVCSCLRQPVPGAAGVEVWRDLRHQAAHYKQLFVCGSVWSCAVCQSKITEVRREQLSAAVKAWGGQIALVTVTLQHKRSDGLSELLGGLLEAVKKMRQGRRWQAFEERYGLVGTIRALECTYGSHGFHPHAHYLFFLAPGQDMEAFTRELRGLYLPAVAKVGRYADPKWGIDVRWADAEIADYVAKWGKEPQWTVAHELAKSASKAGREHGLSMSELLDAYAVAGDVEAGRLWREFALTFKGKKQLVWSHGLRALLLPDSEEQSDEEIAAATSEESVLLATLDLAAWRIVLANDARYELLEVASSGDVEEIRKFLALLGVGPPG